jgi:hypothetical protein
MVTGFRSVFRIRDFADEKQEWWRLSRDGLFLASAELKYELHVSLLPETTEHLNL